jgi:hypothetical protein
VGKSIAASTRRTVERAAAVEHKRAEQRDPGAIDLEPQPAADRHAEVHGREDDEDEGGQVRAIMPTVTTQ